jgi:hypothetical protein
MNRLAARPISKGVPMQVEWRADNTLDKPELKAVIKSDEGAKCSRIGCERGATDIHHVDGNHSNNETSNLVATCKLCHDEVHGISAEMTDLKLLTRLFYEAQAQRKAAGNRVGAYERLGIPVPVAKQALDDAKEYEEHLQRRIRAMLKVNLFYNAWLKHVKGIGPLLAASLLSEMGSPTKFNTVSALWSYCGLGVRDGKARRRRKGEHANWNPMLKATAWKVAGSFVRSRSKTAFGRQLYDHHKAYYSAKDGDDLSKGQIDNRARRRVVKDFLRCMWVAWMQAMNLPVTEPRQGTWPMPEHWIEGVG